MFEGWSAEAARAFCERWLPAWTGNDPERLLSFYAADAFYSDPAVPLGLLGRERLMDYFRRLLAAYPEWVWTHRRSLPLRDGFLNFWDARLDASETSPRWSGVCVVQIGRGLIIRNEVFMDRSAMPRPTGGGRAAGS
ncbi:MAG: nuclear transport factor 2 family protein [Allosphingosinicella sp.]|uniref:nuclear transport factor 2 family protein n=1 Tax=Allosphingosinicella sp. TaxID=2823234 RepID=UPI00392C7803